MEHKHLIYLILISITFSFCCCNNKTQNNSAEDSNPIYTYLKESQSNINIDSYNKIILLTDNGCRNCNHTFAKIVENNYLEDNSTLILTTSKGSHFNIIPFKGKSNVLFDWNIESLIPISSSVLYIKKNTIDTIITIDAKNFEEQMDYIVRH